MGKIIIYFGLYLLWSISFGRPQGAYNFEVIVVVGIIGLIIVSLGQALNFGELRRKQKQMDENALNIFLSQSSEQYKFSIFLRSFDLSGKFKVESQMIPSPAALFHWDQYVRPGEDALERLLADAYVKTAPLIGLGGRGTIEFGLASAGLVDDWQSRVRTAMLSAYHIIIIPSESPGTTWEFSELIRLGLLHKTIIILPPTKRPFSYADDQPYSVIWSSICEKYKAEFEIELPEYVESGLLIMVKHGENNVAKVIIELHSPKKLAASINKLISI